MQENKWYKSVKLQLECLSRREKLMKIEELARLVASRITQGWAFMNISREQHNKDIDEIIIEVKNHLV